MVSHTYAPIHQNIHLLCVSIATYPQHIVYTISEHLHSLPIRSHPGLTRIAILVSGSVVVIRFQHCIKSVMWPKKTGYMRTTYASSCTGSGSCGPRKQGVRKLREYITGTAKSRFSRIHNPLILHPMDAKAAVEVSAYQGRLNTKFEENRVNHLWGISGQTFVFFLRFFFFFFSHKHKNCFNTGTHTLIGLKFSKHVEQWRANISTKFGDNPLNSL